MKKPKEAREGREFDGGREERLRNLICHFPSSHGFPPSRE